MNERVGRRRKGRAFPHTGRQAALAEHFCECSKLIPDDQKLIPCDRFSIPDLRFPVPDGRYFLPIWTKSNDERRRGKITHVFATLMQAGRLRSRSVARTGVRA